MQEVEITNLEAQYHCEKQEMRDNNETGFREKGFG